MHLLDDIDLIKKIDLHNVYDQIIHYPQCAMLANEHMPYNDSTPFKNKEFKSVVFLNKNKCSTTRIFREVLKGTIEVMNTDKLNPLYLKENTLVIYIDFDTERIKSDNYLSIINDSPADMIMISSELNKVEFNQNGYYFTTPNIPSLNFPYLYTLVIKSLIQTGILEGPKLVNKIAAALITKAGAITRNQPFTMNMAKSFAHHIHGRIPLIYYAEKVYRPVAGRLKNQINRISKYPAFYSSYDHALTYEIGVWNRELLNENYIPIIISKLSFETPEHDEFKELLSRKGINYLELFAETDNDLVDFAALIYFIDMVAFYLAMLGQNDPVES